MKLKSFGASVFGLALGYVVMAADSSAGTVPSPGASRSSEPGSVTLVHARRYDPGRHGRRFRYRTGPYVHFYGGYWYATPWWTVGPVTVSPVVPAFGTPAWYTYCKAKYKTWDPRRGKWRNTKGVWVPCA